VADADFSEIWREDEKCHILSMLAASQNCCPSGYWIDRVQSCALDVQYIAQKEAFIVPIRQRPPNDLQSMISTDYSAAWMAATILSMASRSAVVPGRWFETRMEKMTVRPLAQSR
jgi:hypothetical protein